MKKLLLLGIISLSLIAPSFAMAQSANTNSNGTLTYTPLEPLPFIPQEGTAPVSTILNAVLKILIIAGAFMAVGSLVFYGIEYMMSDVAGTKLGAKGHVMGALWGLLLLLGAWLILYTINPQLLNFSNDVNPVPGASLGSDGYPVAGTPASTVLPPACQLNSAC